MHPAVQASTRFVRLGSLFLLTLPLAICILGATYMVQLELPQVLTFCGLVVATIGGCTKFGSP